MKNEIFIILFSPQTEFEILINLIIRLFVKLLISLCASVNFQKLENFEDSTAIQLIILGCFEYGRIEKRFMEFGVKEIDKGSQRCFVT